MSMPKDGSLGFGWEKDVTSMTDFDRTHVREILGGHGDWFTAQLFRLIAKADTANRQRLYKAFPEEVTVVSEYLGRNPLK